MIGRRGWAAAAVAVLAAGVWAVAAGPDRRAPCANGHVALTFDDGPTAATPRLLEALGRSELRATMFVIGDRVIERPQAVRALARAGMWIENHTLRHRDLARLSRRAVRDELALTQDVVGGLVGRPPALFRPPFLSTDGRVRAVARDLGLTEVLATADPRDYRGASADAIVGAARRLEPGGILLLHDGPRATVAAVPRIAEVLEERGLCTGRIAATPRAVRSTRGRTFHAGAVAPVGAVDPRDFGKRTSAPGPPFAVKSTGEAAEERGG